MKKQASLLLAGMLLITSLSACGSHLNPTQERKTASTAVLLAQLHGSSDN